MPFWSRSRKALSPNCIGVSLHTGGFAVCVVDRDASTLISADFCTLAHESAFAETLQHWVRDHGVKGSVCHVSLGPDDYKLLPAETPAVAAAEINQALLWGLRDVIDSKPEDTVIDSFPSASGIHRPGKPIRHVVTARKSRIRAIVDAVLGAGLKLGAIEIPELSQRNAIALLEEDAIGVGLVSQNARGVSVTLYRAGELYVTRQLAGMASLADAGHPLTAPRLVEQLGLELLRTLDYYDSQLRQRPPAAILLQPLQAETRPLLDGLAATINLPAKQLYFHQLIATGESLATELQERCFVALGAALRNENAAQQINLFTEEFQPRREWLTARHCAQLWGGAAALGLLAAAGLAWHGHALRDEATALQRQLAAEQSALAAAQQQLAARAPSLSLDAELKRRRAEETAKSELLAALETGVLSGREGYSAVLAALGRHTLDGVWLNAIEIAGSEVNLSGSARKAEQIPLYIDKIVDAGEFGERGYESLDVKAGDGGVLNFALRSRRDANSAAARR